MSMVVLSAPEGLLYACTPDRAQAAQCVLALLNRIRALHSLPPARRADLLCGD
jgi:hypothetical protein